MFLQDGGPGHVRLDCGGQGPRGPTPPLRAHRQTQQICVLGILGGNEWYVDMTLGSSHFEENGTIHNPQGCSAEQTLQHAAKQCPQASVHSAASLGQARGRLGMLCYKVLGGSR